MYDVCSMARAILRRRIGGGDMGEGPRMYVPRMCVCLSWELPLR